MSFTDIAGYRVLRQLGAGGMGQVFLVEHPRLPRQDALKLLDAGVSRNDDFKARFQREADLLAQLSHPNIVTLYDRGEFEGRLWITMEYVEGTDAAQLLTANGPLDTDLALELISGAAAALDFAWRKQRITHRDVKPANILVGIDESEGAAHVESVKLADFGIAKAAGESTSLTSTGVTVGTMQYISPEAIEGESVDSRSDVYSLGCTAFHLLTGRPPYEGKSITALMKAHLTAEPPALSAAVPHLPPALDAVIVKVLAKDPDDRYQTCADFVVALQEAAGVEVDTVHLRTFLAPSIPKRETAAPDAPTQLRAIAPAERRSNRMALALAAVIAVLVVTLAVLGTYAVTRGSSEPVAAAVPSPMVSNPPTTPAAPVSTTVPSTTVATTATAPPITTTFQATTTTMSWPTSSTLAPYEGMPCDLPDAGKVTDDGLLVCSTLEGAWIDNTHRSRPAVSAGDPCTEPGARARRKQSEEILTCQPTGNGGYSWRPGR